VDCNYLILLIIVSGPLGVFSIYKIYKGEAFFKHHRWSKEDKERDFIGYCLAMFFSFFALMAFAALLYLSTIMFIDECYL